MEPHGTAETYRPRDFSPNTSDHRRGRETERERYDSSRREGGGRGTTSCSPSSSAEVVFYLSSSSLLPAWSLSLSSFYNRFLSTDPGFGFKPPSKMRTKVTAKRRKLSEMETATQTSIKSYAESKTMKTPSPKARGRPKKKKEDDITETPSKARGRPKKKKESDITETPPKAKESLRKMEDDITETPPKARGRPKKKKESDITETPPKARGRPKKKKESDITETPPKARERPKKKKEDDITETPSKAKESLKKKKEDDITETPSKAEESLKKKKNDATTTPQRRVTRSRDAKPKKTPKKRPIVHGNLSFPYSSPGVPQGEIHVDMDVIARRKTMSWKMGKVVEIVKKNGRVKYKVRFEKKGKSLVSGFHIARDTTPYVEDLFVGARVAVNCGVDEARFRPGIVAEIPCKNNNLRFLVFLDDHTALYARTISLRLVHKPLADPCRDILNETHKQFMEKYLEAWPNPPQTQYKVGETIQAELNGVKQMCEVLAVDCSLIQVVFQEPELKEWIYNGSMLLKTDD